MWPYMQCSMLFHIVSLGWLGCNVFIIFFSWGYGWVITYPVFMICLQVDGTGNCLFSSVRKSMLVCTTTAQEATYFPYRYFRRMVVNYMVNHHQLIYDNKFLALMSLYGVEERADLDRGWNPPLSFKQYLRLLLWMDFWGDKVVLYTVSCMWLMKITVLNTKTLQEYRIHQDRVLDEDVDVLTFDVVNHFNATGE